MENPALAISGVLLAVSIYMFAALKYEGLLWMFRVKRHYARVLKIGEERNEKIGVGIGRVVAPIIGVAALGASVYFFKEYFAENTRIAERKVEAEKRGEAAFEETKSALSTSVIDLLYKGDRVHLNNLMQAPFRDTQAAATLFQEIGGALVFEDVDTGAEERRAGKNGWKVDMKTAGGSRVTFALHLEEGLVTSVDSGIRRIVPSATNLIQISVPENFLDRFRAIGNSTLAKGSALREKAVEGVLETLEEFGEMHLKIDTIHSIWLNRDLTDSDNKLEPLTIKVGVDGYVVGTGELDKGGRATIDRVNQYIRAARIADAASLITILVDQETDDARFLKLLREIAKDFRQDEAPRCAVAVRQAE